MRNRKASFEFMGFYLGATIGSILYLILVLEMTTYLLNTNFDLGLASIAEITLGLIVGVWVFLFLSGKMGQIIGVLIWNIS